MITREMIYGEIEKLIPMFDKIEDFSESATVEFALKDYVVFATGILSVFFEDVTIGSSYKISEVCSWEFANIVLEYYTYDGDFIRKEMFGDIIFG